MAMTVSVSVSLAVTPARAADDGRASGDVWTPPARADIALVGPEPLVRPVRDAVDELLSREGVAVAWSRPDRLRLDDVLDPARPEGEPIAVWIDASSATEAKIYFRAARGRRFVIRRLPLPSGLGAVAVEEIAQIVKSVLRALGSGTTSTLSLPEARVALGATATAPPPSPPKPEPPRTLAIEVGSAGVAALYAPEIPVAGRLDISLAVLSRRPDQTASGLPGTLGGWLGFGYGLLRYRGEAVGASVQTIALRAGVLWEPWRLGRVSVRVCASAGLDRIAYQPRADASGAVPAPADGFWTPLFSTNAGVRVQVSRHFAVAAGVLADASAARVHYDAYDAMKRLTEVLVPYRVRPGLSLGVDFRP